MRFFTTLTVMALVMSGCGLKHPITFIEKPTLKVNGIYIGLINGVHEAWVNPNTATSCTYRHEKAHARERELGWSTHSLAEQCK